MTPAAHAFGIGTQQDVYNMLGTEALAYARHARENLLAGDGCIRDVFQFVETEIACCAVWFGVLLPEVFGQLAVPAMNPGAESAHLFEQIAGCGDDLSTRAGFGGALFDQRFPAQHISG